jgi:CO/xanthine dehydrogenase Mo-binding subunit
MALEIAIDEMAEKLGLDPVEFRIINDTQVDPEKPERPLLPAQLVGCSSSAPSASAGVAAANPVRGRDGNWLVGMGVAAAFRNNLVLPSGARVRLDREGVVTVETDMTDIGTGSYTIIAQTAAEMMGVPSTRSLSILATPVSRFLPGSGGQFGANSATAGVYAACVKLREAVAQKLGFNSEDVVFENGEVRSGNGPCRLPKPPAIRTACRRGHDQVGRSDRDASAIDLRRALRRGRRRCRHGRDPYPQYAGRLRGRPHPQPDHGPQPGDRRDDDGRWRRADRRSLPSTPAAASSSITTLPATRCRCTPTSRTRR